MEGSARLQQGMWGEALDGGVWLQEELGVALEKAAFCSRKRCLALQKGVCEEALETWSWPPGSPPAL